MIAPGAGLGRAGAIAVVAVAVDQISKAVVRGGVHPGEHVEIVNGVEIVRVANRGIAFGLLAHFGSGVLIVAAIAFAALLVLFLVSAERAGLWLPIGLLAGGAIGNLIDRIREGAVTDFIDLPRWPSFNLADVEITVGVIILVAIYVLDLGPRSAPTGAPEPRPRR